MATAEGLRIVKLPHDIREALYHPAPPQLQNTDGESFQLTKIYYHLPCTPEEALDRLATLSVGSDAVELLHVNGQLDEQGWLLSITFPWLKKRGQSACGMGKHHHGDHDHRQ